MPVSNIKGQKFNRLRVLEFVEVKDEKAYWLCKCDCGNEKIIAGNALKTGGTKSCGCYKKERTIKMGNSNKTHGLSTSHLFRIWNDIKRRCYGKNRKYYYLYGGRGITVCSEWLDKETGFVNFYNWSIENGYKEGLEIDRIDVNGNYEPNNCRWVTKIEQANNKRNNHLITYNGETHTMAEWSRIIGLDYRALEWRINNSNWSIERTLTEPSNKTNKGVQNNE